MSSHVKSPFKCNKVFFYRKKPNPAIEKVIENLKEKDYNETNSTFMDTMFDYIKINQYSSALSFCENNKIGMSTATLCDLYALDKVKGDIIYMICYHDQQPYSILLFTYNNDNNKDNIYIEAICADQTNKSLERKGYGSLLLDDLIEAARETKINSIMLNSVKSAIGFYKKKGFIDGEKHENPDEDDNPMILEFSKKTGGHNKKSYKNHKKTHKKHIKKHKKTYKKHKKHIKNIKNNCNNLHFQILK